MSSFARIHEIKGVGRIVLALTKVTGEWAQSFDFMAVTVAALAFVFFDRVLGKPVTSYN